MPLISNPSGFTSGRVPYVTTDGSLIDSAALLFDGTTFTATAAVLTSATIASLTVTSLTLATQTQAQQIALARSIGIPYILARSSAAVSCPADTSEDAVATITVPANAMGTNGFLRIYHLWSVTNNANAKTLRTRFSGIGGTIFQTVAAANQLSYSQLVIIGNRNAANSQVAQPNDFTTAALGLRGTAVTTGSIDTTAATTIVLSAQKAVAGDTITLESYLVELFPS